MTSEALALSASIFNASIDSWLPPSFGLPSTSSGSGSSTSTSNLFDLPLPSNDRLGLGHRDLTRPGAAAAAARRAGLDRLEKTVKRGRAAQGEEESLSGGGGRAGGRGSAGHDDSEDEESRTRVTKKTKKTKTKDAFARSTSTSTPISKYAVYKPPVDLVEKTTLAVEDAGGDDELDGPLRSALGKETKWPQSPEVDIVSAQDVTEDMTPTPTATIGTTGTTGTTTEQPAQMSKSQARREKRKRAKLARQS